MIGRCAVKVNVGVLSLLFCTGVLSDALKDARVVDSDDYTLQSVLVEIEYGRNLNLYCTGSGSPIVILEAGLGDSAKAWGLVQPEISKHTKVCAYDRAGLGFSDASRVRSTVANAERDLRSLLRAAKLAPPYILVGHSYGALVVKLFVFKNPQKITGLVLVDPSHEDIGKRLFAMHPENHVENKTYLSNLKKCLRAKPRQLADNADLHSLCVGDAGPRYSKAINEVEHFRARMQPRIAAWTSEMTHVWVESSDQVRIARRSLGAMPLVLLAKEPAQPAPNETMKLRERKNREVFKLHASTVALSTQGKFEIVPNSGHYIQLDQPSVVIAAVLKLVHAGADTSPKINH